MTLLHKIKQIYTCWKALNLSLPVKSVSVAAKIAKFLLFWYFEHKVFEREVLKIYWKYELYIFKIHMITAVMLINISISSHIYHFCVCVCVCVCGEYIWNLPS